MWKVLDEWAQDIENRVYDDRKATDKATDKADKEWKSHRKWL